MKQVDFFFVMVILLSNNAFSQVYLNPNCTSHTELDLKIVRVIRDVNLTTIDFEFKRNTVQAGYFIFLSPPNTSGAYYIKAEGDNYKLLSTKGISNKERETYVYSNKPISFSATFEAIPNKIEKFDLIEGDIGSWNFYGIKLNVNSNSEQSASTSSFQNASECDQITFIPASTKPSFESFLRGVRYAMVAKPSNNQQTPMFDALYKYVDNLGLIKISPEGGLDKYDLAEVVFIEITNNQESEIGYNYDIIRKCYNIKIYFTSPKFGFEWVFSTTQTTKAKTDQELTAQYYNCLRSAYGYSRGSFSSLYTLKSAKRKTCWTETTIKQSFQSKGVDNIEGVYQASGSDNEKYRLALKKSEDLYHLVYLSGASNKNEWDEGEIKATLESTATPLLFNAKWIMANKEENNICYISFEKGLMNVYIENDKTTYIKLYPTSEDKVHSSAIISSSGSGFAITPNGLIITNNHVIEGAKTIKVRGINGDFNKSYSAKVIISDKNNDLSIIKIDDKNFSTLGTIPYLTKASASNVGENVFVLGYPLRATMGDEIKLTNGIISSKSGFQGDITSYQITVPVQPGNSGGPLFDKNGNIIGIINAKNLEAENASYAVKSSYLLNLINLLDSPPLLQKVSILNGKPLTQQVQIIKKFVYIIEIN